MDSQELSPPTIRAIVQRSEKLALASAATLLQFPPEGIMLDLTKAVGQLKKEREQARKKVEQLNAALRVLSSLRGVKRGVGRGQTVVGKRRTMSAAARKRIAAAQRARWAKWKAAQKKK